MPQSFRESVGDRLRRTRASAGLTLLDVQDRTAGEFKVAALGAYERGERALSLERLIRLADVYSVDMSAFFAEQGTIDLPKEHAQEEALRLSRGHEFVLGSLAKFAASVRARRNEPFSATITVRATDLELIAVLFGREPHDLDELLERVGIRAPDAAVHEHASRSVDLR